MPRYVRAQSQREPSSPIIFANESPGWRGLAERDLGMWYEIASECSNEELQCSWAGPPAHAGMERFCGTFYWERTTPYRQVLCGVMYKR